MQFHRGVLAALTAGALALGGCGVETAQDKAPAQNERGDLGSVNMALTLPDDSEVSQVTYTITGPNNFSRTGTVPVGNSTVLTFRIAGLPVGTGYTINLTAETSFGNDCAGSATFSVTASGASRVSVLLLCGATDDEGDVIIDGEFESCPLVTSVSAIPGEVRVGGSIALTSAISHGDTPVLWTGAGGAFASANAYDTTFECQTVGTHTLTVTINGAEATCTDSETVEVVCSVAAGCGNGVIDGSEACDDGNASNTDACLEGCVAARCGDGFLLAGGAEECDDGNAVNTDGCSNTCDANVCGDGEVDPGEECDGTAGCSPTTCRLLGCGDGIVTAPETCDDANSSSTDACVACQAARCGDGFVQTGVELCDDGNTTAGDGCEPTCVPTPAVPGDQANQIAACRDCRAANCTAFQGVFDLVASCFENPDPVFVQQCIDVKNCAYENDCGYNATGAPQCFCGTADLNACQTAGAANGPCQPEFFAAARTTQLAELIGRFGDVSLPVGVAYYFQECDRDFCTACQP